MTTQPDHFTLSDDPGEFVAALPGWMTYFPEESLVLAGIASDITPPTVAYWHRIDLTAPTALSAALETVPYAATNHGVKAIELLVIARIPADSTDLPHRELIAELTRTLHDSDITVGRILWTERIEHGLTWRSYTDPTATGPIADPHQFTPTDTDVFASHEELAAQLAPAPDAALAHRANLLQTLPPVDPKHDLSLMTTIIDRVDATKYPGNRIPLGLDDDTIVRLGHALTHPDVWYPCLQFVLTERAAPAAWLWALLTRALPQSIMGYPACLFAVWAHLHGDPLAAVAIDMALVANPDHNMTKAMHEVIHYGDPPEEFRKWLIEGLDAAFNKAPKPTKDHNQ